MILALVVQVRNLSLATELKETMSSDKKDLTRIEDLSEFIHEMDAEDEFSSEDLPELPASEDEEESSSSFTSNFETSEDDFAFGETESEVTEDPFANTELAENTETFETSFAESDDSNDFGTSSFNLEETLEDKPEVESPVESFSLTEEEPETVTPSWDETPLEAATPPEPVYIPPAEPYKAPENFADLQKFSESSTFSGMATEGNPSFSVLIKNVRFIEDVNDIITLLKELNLLSDPEDQIKGRLMRGMLLVPRISEYAAIYLSHKLRRFDIDIQVGLSDEIHPPKHQETPETGIVSKFNLYQNQNHHFHFDDPKLELSQIIVAATSTLEGYQVLRYLGVASEHKMLESHIVEDENSDEVPRHYQELAQKLKAHALKAHSNAVVGLNYQLTPIPSELGIGGHKYRLTCTGNLVWVNKL